MFGLPGIDILVIILYFMVVIFIGFWAMRRIKTQEDYFLGGRRFGKLIQIFAAFGSSTSTDTAVSVTTMTFRNGVAGIWVSLLNLLATPVYWMTSPWYRRLRVVTLGDFYTDRYDSKRMGALYALMACFYLMCGIAVGFTAMTKTLVAITPKAESQFTPAERAEYQLAQELKALEAVDADLLDQDQSARLQALRLQAPRRVFSPINERAWMWYIGIIVLIYAVCGGLEAALITDLLQGNFIILLSIIFFPFAIGQINDTYGGQGVLDAFETIHAQLPESFFQIFGSPTLIDFTWYYIAAISVMVTLGNGVAPTQLVVSGSAKDEFAARVGYTVGSYLKRVCTVLWGVFGLMAIVLYRDSLENSDFVWGYATRNLLGPVGLGLVGLMVACLMSALMSSADAFMITFAGLLTHNIYRPMLPGRTERHYVRVGRMLGTVMVIGGILIASQFDDLLQVLKFTWEVNLAMTAGFWLGMKWRRANRIATWSSMTATFALFFLVPAVLPLIPGVRNSPYLLKTTEPDPVVQVYTVHEMDVEQRNADIAHWDKRHEHDKSEGPRPAPLRTGQKFEKRYTPPAKSIFWTQGIKDHAGKGLLNWDLVVLDQIGFNLADYPYALNETIRVLIRTFFPFLVLVALAFLTRPDDKKTLDRFFVRMKTRVVQDRERDAKELATSYENPSRFDHNRLFPRSQWELEKWDRVDTVGFLAAILVMFGILGLLYLIISIGA